MSKATAATAATTMMAPPPAAPEDDAGAVYRHPLTVLAILGPLAILGSLYRLIYREHDQLFLENVWHELGGFVGIQIPFVPSAVLIVGCLLAHLLNRQPWHWTGPGIVAKIIGWSLVWTALRVLLGFTAHSLDNTQILGSVGLIASAALQEELIFRGFFIGVCVSIPIVFGISRPIAQWLCIGFSALLFSLAHCDVVNPSAPPFSSAQFIQHTLAGILYGVVFVRQGLAVTTLTHISYNFLVMSQVLKHF